jgi:hypothetical protein
MLIKVRCTLELDVEVPDNWDRMMRHFDIEENSCPATRYVGSALDKLIAKHDAQSTCWGCAAKGRNEIVDEPAD